MERVEGDDGRLSIRLGRFFPNTAHFKNFAEALKTVKLLELLYHVLIRKFDLDRVVLAAGLYVDVDNVDIIDLLGR